MIGFILGCVALFFILMAGRYFFDEASTENVKWNIGYWTGFIGAMVTLIINMVL